MDSSQPDGIVMCQSRRRVRTAPTDRCLTEAKERNGMMNQRMTMIPTFIKVNI